MSKRSIPGSYRSFSLERPGNSLRQCSKAQPVAIPRKPRPHFTAQVLSTIQTSSITALPQTPFRAETPRKPRTRRSQSKTSFPSTSSRILANYNDFLSQFERTEILAYNEIYYAGITAKKLENNFDDAQGFYVLVEKDHLGYRYEIKQALGNGTFGQVALCYDHKENCQVAIKIFNSQRNYAEAGKIEAKLLSEINATDVEDVCCVIRTLSQFEFRGHFCIVLELLGTSLYQMIEANEFKGIHPNLVKRIAHQIILALKCIHDLGIIHCDIKPDNVMLTHGKKTQLKLIDFSSACRSNEIVNDYVQSRYYRAPEIIFNADYSSKIDIWSLGCVVVELVTGKVMFPAQDESELFKMIIDVIGLPNKRFVRLGRRKHKYVDKLGRFKIKTEPCSKKIEDILAGSDDNLISFVKSCLAWNPEDRITANAALLHPWFIASGKL
jgi:dual specificity tyrosine-phosphorylation-regulated kinase 2/3/4